MGKLAKKLNSLRSKSQHTSLRGNKDLDENKLIELLNDYWSHASFGYPIHEDVRIPSSVAEMLRTESQKNLNDVMHADDTNKTVQIRELLRQSLRLHHRPDLLKDYERLLKQWERS